MAVINIEKEMPESCGMCDHRTVCTVFGKGWADANNRYSLGVHSRLDDCPLKSVDGLIEEIRTETSNPFRNSDYQDGLMKAMDIIKEYCGGEQE